MAPCTIEDVSRHGAQLVLYGGLTSGWDRAW